MLFIFFLPSPKGKFGGRLRVLGWAVHLVLEYSQELYDPVGKRKGWFVLFNPSTKSPFPLERTILLKISIRRVSGVPKGLNKADRRRGKSVYVEHIYTQTRSSRSTVPIVV